MSAANESDRENYATAFSLRIYLLKCLRKSSAMAFPRPLKFGIFLEAMPSDPLSLGNPRRSLHSSCAYTSKSHPTPLKDKVFHHAISRRANDTSMLVVRLENSPIQSCSFRLVISLGTCKLQACSSYCITYQLFI